MTVLFEIVRPALDVLGGLFIVAMLGEFLGDLLAKWRKARPPVSPPPLVVAPPIDERLLSELEGLRKAQLISLAGWEALMKLHHEADRAQQP